MKNKSKIKLVLLISSISIFTIPMHKVLAQNEYRAGEYKKILQNPKFYLIFV